MHITELLERIPTQRQARVSLIIALLGFPLLTLAVRVFGFKRLRAFLERAIPLRTSDDATDRTAMIRGIAFVVNRAAYRGPLFANCLKRSLMLWALLRRYGVDSQLKIGVRKGADGLEAHAWIEQDGKVINDRPAFVATFAPFAGDIMAAYRFMD